jgi:Fe-S-cluster-containing dehydrogenase component
MDRRTFLRLTGIILGGCAAGSGHGLIESAFARGDARLEDLTLKKWAMVVNLRACGKRDRCRDCIDACHRVHNVPGFSNPKDEIKWIWTAPLEKVFGEEDYRYAEKGVENLPVPVLCNHCENPPCVKVCPTKATWKRADGIVMMDYHRCIGCRYCMAACPYGARSFNWRDPRPGIKKIEGIFPTRTQGVVEKCNFCEERLVKGLPPACVEACKEKGLIFGDLNRKDSEVRAILRTRFALRRKPHLGTEPKVYYVW